MATRKYSWKKGMDSHTIWRIRAQSRERRVREYGFEPQRHAVCNAAGPDYTYHSAVCTMCGKRYASNQWRKMMWHDFNHRNGTTFK